MAAHPAERDAKKKGRHSVRDDAARLLAGVIEGELQVVDAEYCSDRETGAKKGLGCDSLGLIRLE